eukprot:744151-Pyramimonas_sp.AAC.1
MSHGLSHVMYYVTSRDFRLRYNATLRFPPEERLKAKKEKAKSNFRSAGRMVSVERTKHPYNTHPNVYNIHPDAYNIHPDAYNIHPNVCNVHPNAYNIHTDAYNIHSGAYNVHTNAYNIQTDAYNIHGDACNIHPSAYNSRLDAYNIPLDGTQRVKQDLKGRRATETASTARHGHVVSTNIWGKN